MEKGVNFLYLTSTRNKPDKVESAQVCAYACTTLYCMLAGAWHYCK